MTWHVENCRINKPAELRYLSDRFILVETKLGLATEFLPQLIGEIDLEIKKFRANYKPIEFNY